MLFRSENYHDVSSVDAGASDVLANKKFVDADGTLTAGTMPNNGTVTKTLDTATTSYTIAKGYHSGTGKVSVVTEIKTATPTKAAQEITPTSGKVLSKVTVAAIPTAFQDVTTVTADAGDVLTGKKIVTSVGTLVTGTMPNNGAMDKTIDGLTTTSVTIPSGYTSGGTVSLTDAIETELATI